MNIYFDTLKRIADTSSRKEKESILQEIKDSQYVETFKSIFVATYDPSVDYYIKDFELPEASSDQVMSLEDALVSLNILSERELTGNSAREFLNDLLSDLTEEQQSIIQRVIKRDLKCGVSATTINKVFPDLIYQHPYMRCESFTEKTIKNIKFPCYAQLKLDGLYCDIMVTEDDVVYMSRNGSNLLLNDPVRDTILTSYARQNGSYVLSSEVIVHDEDGNMMDRESSNGYINSDDRDMNRVCFYVWDLIDYSDFKKGSSDVGYEKRYDDLLTFDNHQDRDINITLVETVECENIQHIIDYFKEVRENELEGVIIKDKSGLWKDGTSKHQIKVKVVIDVDLKVFDYRAGDDKYKGMIGSIGGVSSDGLVKVYAGTGLKDKDRLEFMNHIDDWIQSGDVIMKIKCNGLTQDSKTGEWSLFLPRFVEIRPKTDKTDADSFEKIKETEDSFLDMLKLIA